MTTPRILVPVDFSNGSRAALEYAAVLARSLNAELTVLHAWDCPPFARQLKVDDHAKPSLADLVVESAHHELEEFISSARLADGVPVLRMLLAAPPCQAILQAAREGAYDLMVMSTRGLGAIETALLGSVARRVMGHAAIPVLFIPASAGERWGEQRSVRLGQLEL